VSNVSLKNIQETIHTNNESPSVDVDAKSISKKCTLNSHEILGKALLWIFKAKDIDKTIKDFEDTDIEFKTLFRYYKNFTTKYRNEILHGLREPKNLYKTLVKYLFNINKDLILTIEKYLKSEFSCSCFDTPSQWGAKRITKANLTEQQILEHLTKYGIRNKSNKSPLNLNSVKKGLKKLGIEY